VLDFREEVEFMSEQIQSQKLYLKYLEQQLQQLQEELSDTNQEMEYINSELCSIFSSLPMTLDQAKESAKTILASQKPTRESLAQLLSAIYGSIVEPWELGLRESPPSININLKIRAEIDALSARRKQLKAERKQLKAEMLQLKTLFASCQIHVNSFRVECEKFR
jgi:septal ring factor EnvC (AmiA/AmiB activator)